MTGEMQITYDLEVTLTAPPGGILDSIAVKIEFEPKVSGCLIYGKDRDGNFDFVEVHGNQEKLELPFAHPEIYVKYLNDLQHIRVWTLGFRDSGR